MFSDKMTQQIQRTMYISLRISYVDKPYLQDIKIKKMIEENGVCNIENVAQYWDRIPYKSEEYKPKSNRIQINLNRHDLSIRLLHPHSSVWNFTNIISYYEEDNDKDIKKTIYEKNGTKFWLCYAGSTSDITKLGLVYGYPNKIKIFFKLKEKMGNFVNVVKEIPKKTEISQKFIKEIDTKSVHSKETEEKSVSSKDCVIEHEKLEKITL